MVGISQETFFTLSHALRAFSECIKILLVEEKFLHVLPGRMNNDPIEMRFSLNRCLSGNHLALDIASFYQNEQALLLQLVGKLCTKPDESLSKIKHKYFFEVIDAITNFQETNEINRLKIKWNDLTTMSPNATNGIVRNKIIPYVA